MSGKGLLLSSIHTFFKNNKKHYKEFVDILNGDSNISLRLLDWLVTHYSKNNNIIYWIDNDNIYTELPNDVEKAKKCKQINLYYDYRAQLKSYTKFYFDPFRRHNRITYFIDHDNSIETTIGQLNFFRWIFTYKILEYAKIHLKTISKCMSECNSKKKNGEKEKKISQHINHVKCYVHFD